MVALSSYKLVNCFILLLVVILILVRCVVLFDIKILVSQVLLPNCQVEKCLNEIYFLCFQVFFFFFHGLLLTTEAMGLGGLRANFLSQ